jgi:hypothetical protein
MLKIRLKSEVGLRGPRHSQPRNERAFSKEQQVRERVKGYLLTRDGGHERTPEEEGHLACRFVRESLEPWA